MAMRVHVAPVPPPTVLSASKAACASRLADEANHGPGVARCRALDGLRGIAMLMVVLHHAYMFAPASAWLAGGFIGVDLFFVLSGYLITTLLLAEAEKTGGVRVGRFF